MHSHQLREPSHSLAVLLAFAAPASASLPVLVSESSSFGPDTVTHDTSTGLQWLDLTQSAYYSYNDMAPELLPGGIFDGWSYATAAQLDYLFWTSAAIPASPLATRATAMLDLMGLIGISYTYASGGSLQGSSSDSYAGDTGHWLVRSAPTPVEPGTWGQIKTLYAK